MADRPATHYVTTSDGVHIAYQVFGEGPDLLYCIGLWWHLDHQWDIPAMRRQLERLGRIRRVIAFDKRGTGLSDRVEPGRLGDLDARLADLRAVVGATGSEHTDVLGHSHAADVAIAFAATQPEWVASLVIVDGYARLIRTDDHPWGLTQEQADAALERMEEHWDQPQGFSRMAEVGVDDPLGHERWMSMQRVSVSPGAAAALWRMAIASDVRHLLPLVKAPTLVVHHDPNRLIDPDCGRYLAATIPGARLHLLPGRTRVFDDDDHDLEAIEEFLTGRPAMAPSERFLGTVLFTDLVDSTARAASLGDRHWRSLLDEHDRIVERVLARHGGRAVNPTGDGLLALFDTPAAAVRCAADLRDQLTAIDLDVRAGVHTGEIDRRGDDVAGIAVNIGARIAALAGAGEILVSRTVTDLVVGSGMDFDPRGEHQLKGVPGSWALYAAIT